VTEPQELAEQYAALWNEPHPAQRRQAIAELWTEDAVHTLQPPQEVYETAQGLGMRAMLQSRGHAELESRVTLAYEQFVAGGEYSFRARANAARVGDVVKFGWEMVSRSGEVAAVGLEFATLDAEGRIRLDYQFIES